MHLIFEVLRLKYDYKNSEFVIDNNGNVTHDINGVPWCVFKDKNNRFYVDLQDAKGKRGINNFDESQIKTGGFVDSIYMIPSAIDKEKHPDVYNRIIVVGGIGNHDIYTDNNCDKHFTTSSIYSNSNLGKRCDILAPAEDVFSCISSSKYGYETGTSMAAPHVSGVAAMVWVADSSLTGAEVKQIVCSAQNTNPLYNPLTKEASDLKWRVLDAEKAVKSAVNGLIPPYDENVGRITIKIDNDKLNPSPENGGILGYIVDSYDQKELTGVAVTAIDEKGKEYTVQTDSEGHFELVLPQGVYTIKTTKAGCIETVLPETYAVKPEEVITLKENILLESVESALINAVIDNESVWKDSSSEMWFQDLNFDGQNELIVGNMFRYEVYTYVNNSLHKVAQQGNVNENWHPLYNMKLCYNAESEKYVGITRIGITMWVGMFETSYENDKLKFTEIVSMNEGDAAYGVQSTWYDGSGNTITESEYVDLYNNYFKNLTEVAYTTDSIMLTDYNELTRNEKFNSLKKSYEAFKIGEEIGGFSQIEVSASENRVDIYEDMEITLSGIIRPQHYEKDMVIGDTAVLDLQNPFTAVFHGGNRDGETEFIETVQVEIEGVEAPELGMFTKVTGKIMYARSENHICSIVLTDDSKTDAAHVSDAWKETYLKFLNYEYKSKSYEYTDSIYGMVDLNECQFALVDVYDNDLPDLMIYTPNGYSITGAPSAHHYTLSYFTNQDCLVYISMWLNRDDSNCWYYYDRSVDSIWNEANQYSLEEIKSVIQNY